VPRTNVKDTPVKRVRREGSEKEGREGEREGEEERERKGEVP
jgi:hypothetical protein